MRVGMCMQALYPFENIEQAMARAMSMQVDSLWAPDHLLGTYHPSLWHKSAWRELVPDSDGWFDPYCLLAKLSNATDLPLGLSVTDGTRRKAVDVARSALTLQHMCKGGFNLGVGSGEAESLVPFGYPFERPVGCLEEFLAELRHILDTGQVPGDTCGRLGLPLESAAGKPRVWVAAHGPRMLRLAGEYADGWLPAWKMTADEYAEKRRVIAQHAANRGRPAPESGLFAPVVLGKSRSQLLEKIDAMPQTKLLAIWVPGEEWERHGFTHPAGRESRGLVDVIVHDMDPQQLLDVAESIPATLLEGLFYLGNVDELLGTFEQFAKAGLEHIVVGDSSGSVGGLAEIAECAPEMQRLCDGLAAL